MIALHEYANQLNFGELVQFENLAMLPVMVPGPVESEPGYLLFEEAAQSKLAVAKEFGGGVVPHIVVENCAELPLLLIDGQELVGAKQNRMLNLTILVPAKSTTSIPVSCVEAGRWSLTSPVFAPSDFVASRKIRAMSVTEVTASIRMSKTRMTDQMRVWDDVAVEADLLGAPSRTGAMRETFRRRFTDLEEFVRAMPWREGQIGAAFLLEGRPVGIDVFDHPRTMQATLPKLVRSYALDALAEQRARQQREQGEQSHPAEPAPKQTAPDAVEAIRQWLSELEHAETIIEPAVGMGQDVRSVCDKLTSAALWAEERYVHFCAFPLHFQTHRGWKTGGHPSQRGEAPQAGSPQPMGGMRPAEDPIDRSIARHRRRRPRSGTPPREN